MAFEGIKAEVFGNEQKVLIGCMSGAVSTKSKLHSLGYSDASDEVAKEIFGEIKRETEIRKSVLHDECIKRITNKVLGL